MKLSFFSLGIVSYNDIAAAVMVVAPPIHMHKNAIDPRVPSTLITLGLPLYKAWLRYLYVRIVPLS